MAPWRTVGRNRTRGAMVRDWGWCCARVRNRSPHGLQAIGFQDRLATLTRTPHCKLLIFNVTVPRPATGQTEKREDFPCERQKNDVEIICRHHCKSLRTAPTLVFAAERTEASAKAGLKCWWWTTTFVRTAIWYDYGRGGKSGEQRGRNASRPLPAQRRLACSHCFASASKDGLSASIFAISAVGTFTIRPADIELSDFRMSFVGRSAPGG